MSNIKSDLQKELNELNEMLAERNRLENRIFCVKEKLNALEKKLNYKRDAIRLMNEIMVSAEKSEEPCQFCRNLGRICAACS